MGELTNISWTDHSFNTHWGCVKVSPGCENCYAETMATRWGHDIWGPAKTTHRRVFGANHWAEPLGWDKAAYAAGERRRVFCASFGDVFEDHPELPMERQNLWPLIASTPNLDWLLLTKRPENVPSMVPPFWMREGFPQNVWMGTSVETQEYAEKRIPLLLALPARVRFLSIEPQLGPVDLWAARYALPAGGLGSAFAWGEGVSWVICGGESGPKHRPFDVQWARDLRDQCQAAGVAFHFKQFGGLHHADGGCLLDGVEHKAFPTNGLRELVAR